MVRKWRYRAFLVRYCHLDLYDYLQRDPKKHPLSALELAVFAKCVEEHVVAERRPFDELGLSPEID